MPRSLVTARPLRRYREAGTTPWPTRSCTRCTCAGSREASGRPPELRGTYAGLAHEAAVKHLVDLGITTVELLPIHHNVPESFLVERD